MPRFDRLPRVTLAHLPTPLDAAPRLSEALGGPGIWLKRDDCTGLATGGNKTRKLEYLLAEARVRGADTVITFGAVQSNHARQTAAACARLGLHCELILSQRVRYGAADYETGGNVLLDRLCGARLNIVATAAVATTLERLRKTLEGEGRHTYVIPAGGSNVTGALGYVRCAAELIEQARVAGFTPAAIVHATSSGGTQAGLIAGLARLHAAVPVIGINTYDTDHAAQHNHIRDLTNAVLERLALPHIDSAHVHIEHGFLGEDYGLPTPAMAEAVRLTASTEGLLLDPVYSGKGMAGLIGLIRAGRWHSAEQVIFLHTGGTPALPLYGADLAAPG